MSLTEIVLMGYTINFILLFLDFIIQAIRISLLASTTEGQMFLYKISGTLKNYHNPNSILVKKKKEGFISMILPFGRILHTVKNYTEEYHIRKYYNMSFQKYLEFLLME